MTIQDRSGKPENRNNEAVDLQRNIEQTRSAIGEDLKALGEKLSPEQLKEGAREVIQEAKEGAKEVLRDAKDVAVDSLRSAKDHAFGAVSDTVGEIRDEARRMTHATTEFATRNAVPLALIGLGAGWLMLSLRNSGSRQVTRSVAWDERGSGSYRGRQQYDREREYDRDREHESSGMSGMDMSGMRNKLSEVSERARHGVHELSDRAVGVSRDLSHGAMEQWERGRDGVMSFARENPLAVGAAVVATGVGVGLLLPTTSVENQWMGRARDELMRETKEIAGEVREAAERIGRSTREAVSDVQQAAQNAQAPNR
jgi:vacuolar-type H+-ATPase subunit H